VSVVTIADKFPFLSKPCNRLMHNVTSERQIKTTLETVYVNTNLIALSLIYLLTLELSTSHQQLTNHQIEQEEFY
jgi:hypothetical protein